MSQSASEHAVHFVTPPLRNGKPYENPALPELPRLWSLNHPDTAPIPDEAAAVPYGRATPCSPISNGTSECVADMAEALARRAIETGASRHPELVALSRAAGLLHDIAKSYTVQFGGSHAQIGASWVIDSTGSHKVAQAVYHHVEWPWPLPEDLIHPVFSSFMRTSGPATMKWYRSTSAMKICLSAMEKANTPAPPSIAAGTFQNH